MKQFVRFVIVITFLVSCAPRSGFNSKKINNKSPEFFRVKFETTKGNFEIESFRKWSPLGVDRLYQLITQKYYNNTPIYRVVPNYVAQFGSLDTAINNHWLKHKIIDEPVLQPNVFGTMSFARSGINTRGTQLYINIKDNSPRLDTLLAGGVRGYPVIANVTEGMDIVLQFFSYGGTPASTKDSTVTVATMLKNRFPNMDYIIKASIIK